MLQLVQFCFLALIISLFPSSSFAQAKLEYTLTGQAMGAKSKQLLYTERHLAVLGKDGYTQSVVTEYLTPSGKVFARMKNSFHKSLYIPDLEFTDDRFDLKQTQSFDQETNKVTLTQKLGKKDIEIKTFKAPASLVSSQGFDNFVKNNFDKPAYIKMPIEFVVLEKLDFYSFDLIPKTTMKGQKEFVMKASSFFVKLFSEEVILTYDSTTKRLIKYEGLSNLASDTFENQDVLIHYTWK